MNPIKVGLCVQSNTSRRLIAPIEYQPVYDEFSAILVLVLAFVYRYELNYHDLGIEHNSFVAQLLERGHRSIPANELTEEQGGHLCGWLRGLFDADKEGLSNDVFKISTSSCPHFSVRR
jgi:hypothetical protein